MHHAFWADHDPAHPAHDPAGDFRSTLHDYYAFLDAQLGAFLGTLPDDVTILVVSDHGAQAMHGGFSINEWLIERGDLVLHQYPKGRIGIDELIRSGTVDWSRTKAWATGGYCGRIFLNVQGRQPKGALLHSDVTAYVDGLACALEALQLSSGGHLLQTRTCRPAEVYREVNGHPPDLLVYFGNLAWRAIGSVGMRQLQCADNDTGPDQANHRPEGLYIRPPHGRPPGRGPERQITDVHGWILDHFNLPPA